MELGAGKSHTEPCALFTLLGGGTRNGRQTGLLGKQKVRKEEER